MKNKIITLTLAALLTLSSTSAFAAEMNDVKFKLSDYLRNCNIFYTIEEPVTLKPVTTTQTTDATKNTYTEQQTQQDVQTEIPAEVQTTETTAPTPSSNYEERVAQLVNIEREKNGLKPLTFDPSISNVARVKSKDMADNNYFAHQSPTYGSAGDMLRNFGINWSAWGENIASGQDTPEEVVNAWMNSEGHRANILSPNFNKIGVGYVTNANGTPYWTQMFTN